MDKNIVIIGGGPAGYNLALNLASTKKNVILIEEKDLGGVCLNEGCIPTKMLLHYAKEHRSKERELISNIEWKQIKNNIDNVIKSNKTEIYQKLIRSGIKIYFCKARFYNETSLEIFLDNEWKQIKFEKCIIATGSKSLGLPFLENSIHRFDSSDLLLLEQVPNSLLVIGGGVIGMEMAEIFEGFGSKVKIVEQQENILTTFDKDAVGMYKRSLKEKNIEIYTNSKMEEIEFQRDKIEYIIHNQSNFLENEADGMLVSVGREANIDNLNLQAGKIEFSKQGILVNTTYETSNPNVFAIGDCCNRDNEKLAHVGMEHAQKLAWTLLNKEIDNKYSSTVFPKCCYTTPQIIQLESHEYVPKEEDIQEKHIYRNNPIALINNDTYGFIKLIVCRKTHELLSIVMCGENVTEYAGELSLIMNKKLTIEDLAYTVHAHPTINEELQKIAKKIVSEWRK